MVQFQHLQNAGGSARFTSFSTFRQFGIALSQILGGWQNPAPPNNLEIASLSLAAAQASFDASLTELWRLAHDFAAPPSGLVRSASCAQ